MRVCFISRDGAALPEERALESVDLCVWGGIQQEICYEKELKGETSFFQAAALLSKRTSAIVVRGCITDTRGHKRKSALVAENGKLLGISDMLHVIDGGISSGASLRVYETRVGRMGVVVAEDLLFPGVIKSLALCGSDVIVCTFGRVESIHTVLARAHAYCFGVPILLCGSGYSLLAGADGNVAFASPVSPMMWEMHIQKQYHVVETRRGGKYTQT